MSFTGKPALTSLAAVSNDGFWPSLEMADLLNQYRVPSEYADDVIKTGLTMAIVRVNTKLADVKTAIKDLGHSSLANYAAVVDSEVNGQDVLALNYRHAVFCRAKAFLLKQFNTLNQKPEAENAAKTADETEQWWLNESQGAIAFLSNFVLPDLAVSGKASVYVALI
jgi:hypothetical protein